MVGPDFQRPHAKLQQAWTDNAPVSGSSAREADAHWWKRFDDPTLNRLVELAYENNPDLQAAGVRILQARAALNRSIGRLFPQRQSLSGGLAYFYVPDETDFSLNNLGDEAGATAFLQELANSGSNFQFGPNLFFDDVLLSANWELDFWGKYRRRIQSDKASYLADVASYDSSLVTLVADVATVYTNVRTLQALLRVNESNVTIQEQSLQIARDRYELGETSELDVEQAKSQLARTQADNPGIENDINQQLNALAVLVGTTPAGIRSLLADGPIPETSGKIAAGIPRDLLRRRPDVREAALKAASQSALIGVEVANLLPSFSLTGNFGYSSSNLGDNSLGDLFTWQNTVLRSGASFLVPIFNYGRLVNAVRVQDARFQEALLNYESVVLKAQQEVEDGLSAYAKGQESLTFLQRAVEAAERTTDLSLVRYKEGQSTYTTVLTAQQQQLSVQSSLVQTQGNVSKGLISVYRALGGGWQIRVGGDVISADTRRQMADRTRWGNLLEAAEHLPAVAPEEEPLDPPRNQNRLLNILNVNRAP